MVSSKILLKPRRALLKGGGAKARVIKQTPANLLLVKLQKAAQTHLPGALSLQKQVI